MKESENTHRNDDKRQEIIAVAGKMMAENGPDAVSMNMIAEQLNITKPVLYYYFKNKDELVREAFSHGIRPFDDGLKAVMSENLSVEEKVRRLMQNQVSMLQKKPDSYKYFFKLISMPKKNILSVLIKEYMAKRMAMLEHSFEKDCLSPRQIKVLMQMIGTAILGLNMEAYKHGIENIDKDMPANYARVIANGIKSLKTFAIAALLAVMAAPAMAETITLQQAINIALRENAAVKNAQATSEKYDEYVKENIGGVYPQVNLTGTYQHYFKEAKMPASNDNAINASLGLTQVLWAGGKVGSVIKMAKIYSKEGKEALKTAQRDTVKQVKQMYYAVLLSKKMVGIQKETLDLSKQYLKTIEAKYRQGISSDLELLRQRVEVSNNEPALTKAQNSYEAALLNFKNLLGLEPDAEIELEGELQCGTAMYANPQSLYKKAVDSRPEYKDMKYLSDLYKEMIVIEKAGHYPRLDLFANETYTGNTDSAWPKSDERAWNTYGGVKLSMPIYSGGSVNARIVQAKKQSEIIENNLASLERSIKIGVKNAWLSLNEAASRQESQKTAVEQARKALKATETRFKNGLAGLLDLNDMALAFNKTQTLYSQAAHDVCSAGAQLEWAIGE
ncbi:MAG: TolC family protein [Elusimicrobiales bacterium]|nr:TolC family protein [Elusimicrobiales bacterium]